MNAPCCEDDGCAERSDPASTRLRDVREIRWAVVAGVLLAVSLAAPSSAPDAITIGFAGAAAAAGGSTFIPGALRRVRHGKVGVATLMTMAWVGALALGQFEEAAMLAFLFSISEGLEAFSFTRAKRGLRSLLALIPDTAVVLRDGARVDIETDALAVGDVLIVRPGERIATDGVVIEGRSTVNTAAITGESLPAGVAVGEAVFAGSINGNGVLEVRATATSADNSLARVVAIVEQAQADKSPQQRLADRVARPLVPGVIAVAVVIAGLGSLLGDNGLWLERALVVLVAVSPCALALAVPITVVAAVGAASRFGVIIKGGAALETLGTVTDVAIDKTGTLTRNQPNVIAVVPATGHTRTEVLAVAAALETDSDHPLAPAILAAHPNATPASDVTAATGAGVSGTIAGRSARLGRPGWIEAGDLDRDVRRLQTAGATTILVEHDSELIGAIAVRDDLRDEAVGVVSALQHAGLRVSMLTGDNQSSAAAVAAAAGITDIHADLRPEDKAVIVTRLERGGRVAMVGDGVNDAPALAVASVGIAMGAMGTDVAIETADVALMGHDLRALPAAIDHARRARRIMLQNVGLSLLIVAALLPLAATGALGLTAVVAIHEGAEIVVIANGLRAGRSRTGTAVPTHAPSPVQIVAAPTFTRPQPTP